MNAYILEDRDGEVYVELKVDSISSDFGRFQVYEVVGQSDAEVRAGLQFRQVDYGTTDELISFADEKDLRVTFRNYRTQEDTVIRDWTDDHSFSISLTDSYL